MKSILLYSFRYELPSRNTMVSVIRGLHEKEKTYVCQEVKDVEYLSITTDCWTSLTQDSYFAVTAHGINKDWCLTDKTLCVMHLKERHTSENLSLALKEVCDEYGLTSPTTTCDNASNVVKAVHINDWLRFPCFAHCLNLCVQSGLKIEEISNVVTKAKLVVKHFKHSSLQKQQLAETAKRLSDESNNIGQCTSLIQECPTRWNSCYEMLNGLVKLKPAVLAVLSVEELIPTPSEWNCMTQMCNVLRAITAISETMSAQKFPRMSFMYPTLLRLIHVHLKVDTGDLPIIKQLKKITKSIELYFQQSTQRDMMEVCTYLDPR